MKLIHSARISSVLLVIMVAFLSVMQTPRATAGGGAEHPSTKKDLRVFPSVHEVYTVNWAMVLTATDQTVAFMLTQTDTSSGWRQLHEHFTAGEMIISGVFANLSTTEPAMLITSEGQLITVEPRHLVAIGQTMGDVYTSASANACICNCGGDLEAYKLKNPCSTYNGSGPCIDNSVSPPVTSTLSGCVAGFSPDASGTITPGVVPQVDTAQIDAH